MRQDPFKQRSFIIATRVYLTLLCFFICILFIDTISSVQIRTTTVLKPDRATFEKLYVSYASTLQCPCNQIIIPYNSFIVLSPKYHPVCSSLYISDTWINWISYGEHDNRGRFYQDFRVAGVDFFNMLRSLCSQIQITVNDAAYVFNHSTLVNDKVLPEVELKARVSTILNQFKSDTVSLFNRAIILNKLYARTMFPASQTNTIMSTSDTILTTTRIEFHPVSTTRDHCSCTLNENCPELLSFYAYGSDDENDITFEVPHFFLDCFTSQAVLGSTLECFFDETCLHTIKSKISSNSSIAVSVLPVNGTRFPPNTSIGTFVSELVEEWGDKINYPQYYTQCSPSRCFFTVSTRNDALYALTTLIALLGGLSVVLRYIVPSVTHAILQRMQATNHTLQPTRKSWCG